MKGEVQLNKWILRIGLIFVLLLSGCKNDEATGKAKGETEGTQQNGEQALNYIAPFTGLAVEEPVTTRPIIVTINNHPKARPQSGIASADVVYELLVEGNATRYAALFQSELPKNIGPVRSARTYLINIAKGLDAFYIAHGYSPEAYSMIKSGVVDQINGMQYDGTYFKRTKDRVAPHNSYISAENLTAAVEKLNISLQISKKVGYTFDEPQDSVKIGNKANAIEMNISSNSSYSSFYTYDKKTKKYLKSSLSEPTIDALTGEQIAISNVLFFEAPHRVIDSEGRLEINLNDGGKAYVFQQGGMREVQWENADGLLVAIEHDGSEVKLTPGKTWVQIVPSSPGLATSVLYSE